MRCCGSLLLLLGCVCVFGVPLSPSALEPGNCLDPYTQGAAEQALTKINQDRRQGYVYSLHQLSNAHHMKHGPTGVVFYLTLDFVETKCHVLSKRVWKNCGVREEADMPVYGQCKATIYMNKVKRISKLLRYSCLARSVPASKIIAICPDCPSASSLDDKDVLKTVEMALEKYNKESGNANYFRLLNITRASSQSGIAEYTFADFIIQETVCTNTTDVAQAGKCDMMDCEFAHKGHCSASYFHTPPGEEESVKVDCDIFEPEGAEKEKQRHLLGGEHGHAHNHTHEGTEDHEHTHGDSHEHDHTHGHGEVHYDTHKHDHVHHHDSTREGDHAHDHAQEHSHEHADDHAHNHTHDPAHKHVHQPGHADDGAHDHIHFYKDHHHHHHHHHHGNHTHAHVHDHDHVHNHTHLHGHEHHHHHHDHDEEQQEKKKAPARAQVLQPLPETPVVMPSFPDQPELERPVVMPSLPEEKPEEMDPPIHPDPSNISPQCLRQPRTDTGLISQLFDKDPLFNPMVTE